MAYFGGSQGGRGDPGFFGSLFGAVKGGLRGFLSGGPVGAVTGALSRPTRRQPPPAGVFQRPVTGVSIAGLGLGGPRPSVSLVRTAGGQMVAMPRRRRTNFANPKALRRAISRQNGFVRLAKGALKNSGFKVVSVSSGKVSRATMDKAVAKARHDAQHHA